MMEDRLTELPRGWAWTPLSEVTDHVENVNPKIDPDKEFIYLDIASIDNSQQKITNPKKYFGKDAPSRARQLVKSGDILFSTVRTYLKNIAVVNKVYDGQIASTGFCVIRPLRQIENRFIFWLIQTDDFLNPLNQLQRGTSYPAVRDSDVFPQIIPLPPVPEQHRIVAKIEELFTKLDAGIEALKKIKVQLKRYRQAVLKYAFEGKLTQEWREANKGKIEPASVLLEGVKARKSEKLPLLDTSVFPRLPKGWSFGKLGDLIYIAGRIGWRGLKAEEYTKEGPLFLSVYNLNIGKYVDFNNSYHISEERYTESREIQLENDDILLVKDGAGIGKIGIVKNLKTKATVNSSLLVIRSGRIFIPEFLFYYLMGPDMQRVVKGRITGSATPHLFQRDIKNFRLLIPPLSEQHKIVEEIESRLSIADNVEKVAEQSFKQSERLRQSILKQAFEGKLIPQDPTDEPAEKLLERIKEEKAKREAQNKKTKKHRSKISKQMELI